MEYPIILFFMLLVLPKHYFGVEASLMKLNMNNNNKENMTQKNNDIFNTSEVSKIFFETESKDLNEGNNIEQFNSKGSKEADSLSTFDSFDNLVLNPIFHFKRIAMNNKNMEPISQKKNGGKRFLTYMKPPIPLHHKSIIITKLREPCDPFFPHFDPILGVMNRMMNGLMNMDNLIQSPMPNKIPTIYIKPKREPRNGEEDSSLKFWINKGNDESITFDNRKVDNLEPLINEDNDEDYKTDLWKKFMKEDETKPENNIDENAIKRDTEYSGTACEYADSNDENVVKNYLKDNENDWWTRLALPWKPKIYRQNKKDVQESNRLADINHSEEDMMEPNAFNKHLVGLKGKGEMMSNTDKPKRNKHTRIDTMTGLAILGLAILIVYKISGVLRQEYYDLSKKSDRLPVPVPGYTPPPRYCPNTPQTHVNLN